MKDIMNIHIFLILFFITRISFSVQDQGYKIYEINIKFSDSELEFLNIKYNEFCGKRILSLFNPFLVIPSSYPIESEEVHELVNEISSPIIADSTFSAVFYNYTSFLNYYTVTLEKEFFTENIKNCYFGLSNRLGDYKNYLNDSFINLNILKERNEVINKVFSIKNWENNSDSIQTFLYFGDFHENFIIKDENAIIGSCETNVSDPYWGCSFNKMSFNNNSIDLTNDNGDLYKIYFSSENHDIIFPSSFEKKFYGITNDACYKDEQEKGIICKELFNTNDYFEIKLINNNMKITIEIDNIKRFSNGNANHGEKTRIKYQNHDYFILPLIMFKNFHIQFDATNNLVSFYTTDHNILEITEKEKEKEKKKSSNASTVFLIIIIIILILALGYGIFWFLKRRRNSVEKNINKYNKFEDEDHFQDMNEKRVF